LFLIGLTNADHLAPLATLHGRALQVDAEIRLRDFNFVNAVGYPHTSKPTEGIAALSGGAVDPIWKATRFGFALA